jgi:putative PIG3 family NAD(P)H quinone oxidoreductase
MLYIDHASGGSPDVLSVKQAPIPEPGMGEVLIEVAFAGVNRPDCVQRQGLYPPPPGASPILGLEVSGRIASLGSGVSDWCIGDSVCALTPGGGYAQYCVAPAGHCLPVPENWSLEAAACLPETMFTIWDNVFRRAGMQAGETILVHGGAGGIGTTAIQLCQAKGATVITTVGTAAKAEQCLKLGAHYAIQYRAYDFVVEVERITAGRGVDVILDMIGGTYLDRNLRALAINGRLAQIAFMESPRSEIDISQILRKRIMITGSMLRPCSIEHKTNLAQELRREVWPLLDRGLCLPVIDSVFELSEARRAHERMEHSDHFGKMLLKCR